MKISFLATSILMALGIIVLSYFTPWWTSALWIAGVSMFTRARTGKVILTGGFILALIWFAFSFSKLNQDHADVIAKTGEIMGGVSATGLMLITVLIAFITGSLAGWFGNAIHGILHPETKSTS